MKSKSSSSTLATRDNSLLSDAALNDNVAYVPESLNSDYKPWTPASETVSLSRDYLNSPGMLYNEDLVNIALQIAYGLQHLEKLGV